jgi:cytoskeletal protein CcmA (bactofilin family)
MARSRRLRPSLAVTLVLVLLPAMLLLPGAVTGSEPERTLGPPDDDTAALGPTVVVPAGETTNGSTTASGTRVVVAGRHEGDLRLYGGSVLVAGNVTGDVQAFGAEVRVTGTVGGTLVAYGGTVELTDSGRVGALFNTGGSRVLLDGTVNGSVQATGGHVILGESAAVARDLTYDATLVDRGGDVASTVSPTDRFLGPVGTLLRGLRLLPVLAPLLGLVAGLAGRRWLPATRGLPERLAANPGGSVVAGLGTLLATGALGVLLVVSLVGLPLVVVLACLVGLAGLVGLAVGQWSVGGLVVRRLAGDRGGSSMPVVVGGGVGLLVGVTGLLGVAGGVGSTVALGLLALASLAGVGAAVGRVRESREGPALLSRFG